MNLNERLSLYMLVRLVLWRERLDAMDAEAERQLAAAVAQARGEIAGRLEAEAAGLLKAGRWTHERLETVGRWLDDRMAAPRRAVEELVAGAATLAAVESLAEYGDMLSLGGRAARVSLVDMAPEQVRAWFAHTPLGGGTLSGWVDKAFAGGVRASVLAALQSGGLQGKGTAGLTRDVLRAAVDEGVEVTRRQAVVLARTYTQTANVNAMSTVYEANADIVEGWQWSATLEPGYKQTGRGTCLRCAALDGKTFPLRGGPPCPLHASCRCVKLPKLRTWKDLGMNFEELEEAVRPYTVRPNANIDEGGRRVIQEVGFHQGNYASWLEKQNRETRLATLGPARLALYEAGRVRFEDFVDNAGRLIPLTELAG